MHVTQIKVSSLANLTSDIVRHFWAELADSDYDTST